MLQKCYFTLFFNKKMNVVFKFFSSFEAIISNYTDNNKCKTWATVRQILDIIVN